MEDNPDHALLLRLASQRVDPTLEVRVCAHGRDAVAYLSGAPPYEDRVEFPLPDLVLLDLIMPELDGFGVLAWVRAQPEFVLLPVVVLTSSISPVDQARANRSGASAFHTKPADLDKLGDEVRNIVDRWLS